MGSIFKGSFQPLPILILLTAIHFPLTSGAGSHQNCYFVVNDYELKSFRLDYGNISGKILEKGNLQKNICPQITVDVETFLAVERISMELTILLSSNKCSFCHKAVNIKVDFCKLFKNVKMKTVRGYIYLVFKYLTKIGKLPERCPVPPSKFSLNNITITQEILPTYMPSGPIRFQMWIYAKDNGKEIKLAAITLTGEAKKFS